MARLGLSILALLAAGCGCERTLSVDPMMSAADAIYGGGGSFCARDGDDLTCWRPEEGVPRRVEGLEGAIEDVAFMIGQICARDAAGVACWSVYEPTALRMRALGEVRELRSLSGWRGRFCVLDAEGRVACWRRPDETPVVIEPGGVAHLHVTMDDQMLCAETTEATLRCHEFHDELPPVRTIQTSAITPPLRRVGASTIGGEVWALDAEGLKHGRGQSSVVVTNPFGGSFDAEHREIPFQRVALSRVEEAREVRDLRGEGVWMYLHDAEGVRMVEDHLGRFEVRHRYDFGAPPEALLGASQGLVLVRAGDAVVVRGFLRGDPVQRRVDVRAPVEVAMNLGDFCVRHAGGVSCGALPE